MLIYYINDIGQWPGTISNMYRINLCDIYKRVVFTTLYVNNSLNECGYFFDNVGGYYVNMGVVSNYSREIKLNLLYEGI
jgi:hypothetical protein